MTPKLLQGTVNLPGSKSESNRALMVAAYGGFPLEARNLSEAHDTVLLHTLIGLTQATAALSPVTINCENAGAVARFMMTYLASKPGIWVLTGDERLCQRPMAPLIDALRKLGADLVCLSEPGHLPVRIQGSPINGGNVVMDVTSSSQFASSLLMAAPTWPKGLRLVMEGAPVSVPYIDMTLSIMEHFGVTAEVDGKVVTVRHQQYRPRELVVAVDWSASAFWYEAMALSDGGELTLHGLRPDPQQGDSSVADLFVNFGVKTAFHENGVVISKPKGMAPLHSEPIEFDLNNTPDLFPSIFVTCIALGFDAVFKGISTLYNKESDRIQSLITELSRIYTFINIVSDDSIIIKKSFFRINKSDMKNILFKTYGDHRVGMALAALFPKLGKVSVDEPNVVIKSFPSFWKELKKILTPN